MPLRRHREPRAAPVPRDGRSRLRRPVCAKELEHGGRVKFPTAAVYAHPPLREDGSIRRRFPVPATRGRGLYRWDARLHQDKDGPPDGVGKVGPRRDHRPQIRIRTAPGTAPAVRTRSCRGVFFVSRRSSEPRVGGSNPSGCNDLRRQGRQGVPNQVHPAGSHLVDVELHDGRAVHHQGEKRQGNQVSRQPPEQNFTEQLPRSHARPPRGEVPGMRRPRSGRPPKRNGPP
jgi:hypothetical protein